MPTEEINILNILVEPEEPQSFDINMDVDIPDGYTLNMRTVLPMGGGAINSISVNGVEVPIVEGNVDITVPTSTSELVNDSGFITSSAISGKVDRTELAQVAFTGDYDDLENKPEIPSLDGYATETYVGNAVSAHNESATAHQDIRNEISGINELIPAQATTENQLADKNFVNSSIATETATFRGTYNEVSDLSLTTAATHSDIATALANVISVADSNDYAFVQIPTSDTTPTEIASIERYKFVTGTGWQYEYTLNNSGFTAAQWASINSGITSGLVTQIGTNANDILTIQGEISTLTTGLSGKVSKAGDTMTGGLLFDIASGGRWIGAKRPAGSSLFRDCIYWLPNGSGTYFGQTNTTYDAIQTTFAKLNNNGLLLYSTRGVFENGSMDEENRLQRYDKIFTTGIVSDTKTWAADDSSYTVSNPVSGPIPNDFIETVTLLGANFNTTTLYFELNGLTDITYEEMRRIYEFSPKAIYGTTWQFMFGDSVANRKKMRTNFFNYPTSTGWGNCNLMNAVRANTTIETVSFVQDTIKTLWQSVIADDYSFASVEALPVGTYGYMWQGGQGWTSFCQGCKRLKHIDGLFRFALKSSSAASADTFKECNNLETIWLYQQDRDVSFAWSPKLRLSVLQYIAMHRMTGSTASSTFNVTVHPTVYAACQADTTVYTKGGNSYTGIMALATASNFAIISA